MILAATLACAVVSLTAAWLVAELRRREAERSRDALRADAVQLLLRLEELTGRADALLRRHHAVVPQWQAFHGPGADELQEAASAVDRAHLVAHDGAAVFDRRGHGSVARQDRS